MKRLIACLALFAMVTIASASNTTNYVPDGDFESPNGDVGPWQNMFGGDGISFLSTGGNPNGCLQISDAGSYGGVAYVNPPDLTLASLGLVAGQTYTFVMDMQIVSGASIGGLKLESWTDSAIISDSGNMYPLSGTANWATYSFTYTIARGATHMNIVPLWGPNSTVNYDNIGVVVVGVTPVTVSITSPTNNQVVNSNFTINASAVVSPGTITNVGFYIDSVLVGTATNSPYGYIASGIAAGTHALTAVATDSSGNRATSSVVDISVTNAVAPPLSAYESFNYSSLTSGTPTTGTGFAGNWSCGAAPNIVSGLTYPNLAVANNAMQSSSSYQLETLASAPSGVGSVWVSFIFNQSGDNGGNRDGFVMEDSTGKGIMFAYQQFQATFGEPALTTVSGYTAVGSQLNPFSSTTQIYSSNNFYVLQLTYSGGALNKVAVYSNPTAGQATAPAPDFTVSSGLSGIGVIQTMGLLHQGGIQITLDEVHVGNTFADVAGGNLHPTNATTLALSVEVGKEVSWTGVATNYYQVQSSGDGVNFNNVGNLYYGTNITSTFDFSPEPYYQVQEILPVAAEEIINGGFETSDGFGGAGYWAGGGSEPPTLTTADAHTGSASLSMYVTNATAGGQTSDVQQNLLNMGSAGITGGNSYSFSFWAKSLGRNPAGGFVQRYKITWLDSSSAAVGAVGFTDFPATTNWTQVNVGALSAPTNAVNAIIEFFTATGGILNDYGGVLLDDISLAGSTPTGSINILTPTIQNGAIFTGTLDYNGAPATAASGTVTFKINGVTQSQGALVNGVASSTPTTVSSSYTLTGTYSGDATYIGSSATLVVGGGGVNTTPTSITTSLSGHQFTLSWPADHIGWTLQAQTNGLGQGSSQTWFDVAGSTGTNQVTVTINPSSPTVFYRMKF